MIPQELDDYQVARVADMTGLTPSEVRRRYRATSFATTDATASTREIVVMADMTSTSATNTTDGNFHGLVEALVNRPPSRIPEFKPQREPLWLQRQRMDPGRRRR